MIPVVSCGECSGGGDGVQRVFGDVSGYGDAAEFDAGCGRAAFYVPGSGVVGEADGNGAGSGLLRYGRVDV